MYYIYIYIIHTHTHIYIYTRINILRHLILTLIHGNTYVLKEKLDVFVDTWTFLQISLALIMYLFCLLFSLALGIHITYLQDTRLLPFMLLLSINWLSVQEITTGLKHMQCWSRSVHITSLFCVQWHVIGSLKSTIVWCFPLRQWQMLEIRICSLWGTGC